jgi:SAM-dependent methyltransferase
MVTDLVGYYSLQVGWSHGFCDSLAHSRIRHHLFMEHADPGPGWRLCLRGDARALPVADDALDLVLLPHTLEFAADSHQVLREAERVLIPEGRLIIIGFNPWSLWGLLQQLRRRSEEVPWCGRFLSARRLMDWLALLGFQVEDTQPVMFLPPLPGSRLLRSFAHLEPFGRRWLPRFSATYALRAVKRVPTLTPITPLWQGKATVIPGQAVEPSARSRLDG